MRRATRLPLDVVIGVVVATFVTVLTPSTRLAQPDAAPLGWPGYGLLLLTGLALTVRRRWPVATYLVGTGAAIAYLALRYPGWPIYVGAGLVLVAYLSSTGWTGWPLALAGGAALGIAVGRPEGWQPVRMVTVFVAWLAIAAFTAHATDRRRLRADELTRHRVVEERLRIARELHDVLSHSLATISLRSGTGLRLFDRSPEEARAALAAIRQVSTDGLAQARATLSGIRDPDEADDGREPGLDGLAALFASVRSAGLTLEAAVDVCSESVPPAVASAAYRVVQESLTNVMRHAGPAVRASVTVTGRPDTLLVEVTDTGAGTGGPTSVTPGHGVLGMRERVLALGGEFAAQPAPAGGFRVVARLPLGDRDR